MATSTGLRAWTAGGRVHVTVPVLAGAVEDGDRLVVLISLADPSGGGAAQPDPAAFTDLLQEAYQVQADALG